MPFSSYFKTLSQREFEKFEDLYCFALDILPFEEAKYMSVLDHL